MIKSSDRIFNQRGFTIIEVLISAAILLVTVFTIFYIISYGSSLNKKQLLWRRAYNELECVLESPQFSYMNYQDITADSTYNLNDATLDDRGNSEPGDDLKGQVWVKVVGVNYPLGGIAGGVPAKKVIAFIRWIDEGKTVTDSLETVITLVNIH